MHKILAGVGVLIFALVVGLYIINVYRLPSEPIEAMPSPIPLPTPVPAVVPDYKNTTYTIDGTHVQLVQGISEVASATGSASIIRTRYFGNELWKDLNSDGVDDVVFLITQETGGSGTFYYVVGALKTDTGFRGSEAVLLGDRIAPQTTESGPGNSVLVTYADRAIDESFAVSPHIGKSIRLLLDPNSLQFGEVTQNFEGEADPGAMSLTMKAWEWIDAQYTEGGGVTPQDGKKFTLTFLQDGTFSARTDCNSVGGSYTVLKDSLSFGQMMSTMMYCEGSQESTFTELLTRTVGYRFSSTGELILELGAQKGSVRFR